MTVQLTATRRPMLAGNMTRAELVREAEHTFPNPSPIVRRMIEELRGEVHKLSDNNGTPIFPPETHPCQCPSCGAHLHIDLQG